MTTIAYKNGVIAYDGRRTLNNLIIDDDQDKMVERDKVLFFMSGSSSDREAFIDAYFNNDHGHSEIDISAIVIDNNEIYYSSLGENGLVWKSPINKNSCFAIGSGRDFALAFMDAGLNAEEAVAATAKRDCNSGGTIRSKVIFK